MCRLCLTQNIGNVYIFNDNNDGTSVSHRIRECVTLEVSQNDGLPQNICGQCFQKLNDYYTFRNYCKQSDITLRQHLFMNGSEIIINQDVQNTESQSIAEENIKLEKDDLRMPEISLKIEKTSTEELLESDNKSLVDINLGSKKKRIGKGGTTIKNKKSCDRDPLKPQARGRAPKAKPLCLVCHQKFSRFVELIDHQNKVHNLNLSDVDINSKTTLEELKANIDAFAVFKCHICKEEFQNREELRNHCKTIHNTKVIQPYPCSHCDRQFPAWGLLVVHERKHTGEKPYSCDVCGKQNFISQTSLRRHKLMHLKVYSCKDCGRDFNCDSALKSHIRCKHTNEKPFLCNVCGRNFSLSTILMAHMTSHSSERKYICDICGFASKTSGNHYRHKNTHKTGGIKSFHCETCGKSFDSKLKLSSHQIIHRPVRPHVCKVCNKAFLYKNKLERHILLVHAKERPFPCTLCGKKLASKFGLGIHLKTHNRNNEPKLDKEVQLGQQNS
ncbi:hypothetical protein RUM44_013371 [Polyplax serrata]|uniref:Uncharacterized protein n=1 Tax=Polyplax serrata TaxID=468196 RepID=A0ABR1BDZ8_POLSC